MYIVELQYPGTWLQLANEDKAWEISKLIMSMDKQIIDMAIVLGLFEEETRKVASDFAYENARQQWEQDRDLRFEIQSRYIEELGEEAFYKNYDRLIMIIDREMNRKKWQSGSLPRSYQFRLPFIYAHSFLYALDSFGKFLDVIAGEDGIPDTVCSIRDGFYTALPSLSKIRNSALHIEDRIRGFGTIEQTKRKEKMKLQPINNRMFKVPHGGLVLSSLNGNRLGYTIDDGSLQEIEVGKTTLDIASEVLQKLINSFDWCGEPESKPD